MGAITAVCCGEEEGPVEACLRRLQITPPSQGFHFLPWGRDRIMEFLGSLVNNILESTFLRVDSVFSRPVFCY